MTANFNIADPFFATARQYPDRIAVSVDGKNFTYSAMFDAVRRVVNWLADGGESSPRFVGILASRSWEACVGILGTAWAGGTYVPLNLAQPPSALAALLRRIEFDALIVDHAGVQKLTPEVLACSPKKLLVPNDHPLAAAADRHVQTLATLDLGNLFPPKAVKPDGAAYVEFTSGSTGEPKGVIISNRGVKHFLELMQRRYHLRSNDRVAETADTSFDISVFNMFMTWLSGASLHIVPKTQAMAPAKFIQQHEITIWFAVPSVATAMDRMGMLTAGAFPSLQVSLFSGEPLPVKAALAWKRAAPHSVLDNLYGPTEATVVCLYERVGDEFSVTKEREIVSIGRPLDGADAAVWDPAGCRVHTGTAGELAICGPQVAIGYLADPERTAARFIERDGRRWYLTGDLAYQDETGRFHHLGRIDNQIKVMGHRVELEEVETHLRHVYGTDSVAAVAWPVEFGTATGIVGFISGAPSGEPKTEELRKRMPAYMVPRTVHFLESLPANSSGKVDRKILAQKLEKGEF